MTDTTTHHLRSGGLGAREWKALVLENVGHPDARQGAIAGRFIKLTLIRRR